MSTCCCRMPPWPCPPAHCATRLLPAAKPAADPRRLSKWAIQLQVVLGLLSRGVEAAAEKAGPFSGFIPPPSLGEKFQGGMAGLLKLRSRLVEGHRKLAACGGALHLRAQAVVRWAGMRCWRPQPAGGDTTRKPPQLPMQAQAPHR